MKLCECGCGEAVTTAKYPSKQRRYRWGHGLRGRGGTHRTSRGYIKVKVQHHPRARKDGYVPEQVLVAERVLGKYLPSQAVVHHVNGEKDDNRPSNLVVCEDQPFHNLLHRRERALRFGGNVRFVQCWKCHEYDDPSRVRRPSGRVNGYHLANDPDCRAKRKHDVPEPEEV